MNIPARRWVIFAFIFTASSLFTLLWLSPTRARSAGLAYPDLDLRFIERAPAYAYDGDQKWPEPGQPVTFTAHIANRGSVNTGPFGYIWFIDGLTQTQATHPGLAPGATAALTQAWVWRSGKHTVQVSLDPAGALAETSEANNSLTDRTNALSLGLWVEQSFYDFFNSQVSLAGWGGTSFDDWAQRHAAIWNDMFASANMADRVRIAKIVVVPDGGLHCNTNFPAADPTVDLMWGFLSDQVGVPSAANCTGWLPSYRDDPNTWDRDMGLIHELNHARYHIDLYGFNYFIHARPLAAPIDAQATSLTLVDPPGFMEFNPPLYFASGGELIYCPAVTGSTYTGCTRGVEGTTARAHSAGVPVFVATLRLLDGQGNALLGTPALPLTDPYGDFAYIEPYYGQDIMDGGVQYGEYSAYALNRIAYQRARCGNANSPCNIGEFLDEIPLRNLVEVRSAGGQPIAGATVELYRAQPYPGVLYARQFGSQPDEVYVTGADGQIDLGPYPFSATGEIVHTWGFSNALLALKITTPAGVEVRFLDITPFNLAYWQGNPSPVYPITLGPGGSRPAAGSPPPPAAAALSRPTAPITSAITGTLLVAQAGTDTLSFFNLSSESAIATRPDVAAGAFPTWISASPARVYVANSQGNTISVYNRSTYDPVTAFATEGDPRSVVVSGTAQTAYVTNNWSRSLTIHNLSTGAILGSLPLNASPEAAVLSPANNTLYVVANGAGKIAAVDLTTHQLTRWVHLGVKPQAVAANPHGHYLYAVDFYGQLFYFIDTSTSQTFDVLSLPGQPHRLLVSPDGSTAYVANYQYNWLSVVDLATRRVTRLIDLQSPQWGMDISEDGRILFVALYDAQAVAVIDTTTGALIQSIPTLGSPTAVFFDPAPYQPTYQINLPLITHP